jgi:hypothetical protein
MFYKVAPLKFRFLFVVLHVGLVGEAMSFRIHTSRGFGRPLRIKVWRENLRGHLE